MPHADRHSCTIEFPSATSAPWHTALHKEQQRQFSLAVILELRTVQQRARKTHSDAHVPFFCRDSNVEEQENGAVSTLHHPGDCSSRSGRTLPEDTRQNTASVRLSQTRSIHDARGTCAVIPHLVTRASPRHLRRRRKWEPCKAILYHDPSQRVTASGGCHPARFHLAGRHPPRSCQFK